MSTPNFYNQKNFKLYVQSFEPMSEEEYLAECFEDSSYYDDYIEADDEDDKRDIFERAYQLDMEFYNDLFYEDIIYGADGFKEVMESFNETLMFHKIMFKDGYYTGLQLYMEEIENPYELDNEDCHYYFDMCRSKTIRKYDAEIRKINKWLDKVAVQHGWRCLICLGIFGNGEAVYRYADSLIKPMPKK